MDTPYGEILDKLIKGMSPQDMHDYLKKRYSRRSVLKGAAAVGAVAAAGPLFWKQGRASASGVPIPQWVAYGPNPQTDMYVSWSIGNFSAATAAPNPQIMWGPSNSYGSTVAATSQTQVPVPVGYTLNSSDVDDTYYINVLLTGLTAGTTYHYTVSYDGLTWSPDATFATAPPGVVNYRWVGTGDQATSATSTGEVADWIAAQQAQFVVVAGDLSYASGGVLLGEGSPSSAQPSYSPSAWDSYLSIFGFGGFQSLPVIRGVGNHEMEPLSDNGYAGVLTRFPQLSWQPANTLTPANGQPIPGFAAPDGPSGGPVNATFTNGNVAFIILDGNDVSTEISDNYDYTMGKQTTWLQSQLQAFRAAGSGIDFIVVSFHNCAYCTNNTHSSDNGVRGWSPLFDQYNVDLVINGHVHAYERTFPLIGGVVMAQPPLGGTVYPATQGTTYVDTGNGGQSLYTTWDGISAGGDPNNGPYTYPLVDVWAGTPAPDANYNKVQDTAWSISASVSNPVNTYSAFRKAVWGFIVIDVVAPTTQGGTTTMTIQAVNPGNGGSGEGSVNPSVQPSYIAPGVPGIWPNPNSNVMDQITLSRTSVTGPGPVVPEVGQTALLAVTAAGIAGGAHALSRKHAADQQAVDTQLPAS